MRSFRFSLFWLLIGWVGVGLMVYLSLTSTPIRTTLAYGDKLGHFLAYTLLMSWFVQLFQRRMWLLLHAVLLIAMGATLEFIQESHGRHFEYADMVANTLGVLFGGLTALTPWRDVLMRLEHRLLGLSRWSR